MRMGKNASARYNSGRSGVRIEVCDACGSGDHTANGGLLSANDAAGRKLEKLDPFHLPSSVIALSIRFCACIISVWT